MSYQNGSVAECCDESETSNGWNAENPSTNGWNAENPSTQWSLEQSTVPDYDLAVAMSTEGKLIDTHFHLDFICRRLKIRVRAIFVNLKILQKVKNVKIKRKFTKKL
jgi:hypothetical protein